MRTLAFTAGLLLIAATGHAGVLRCVDAAGRERYTDDPSLCGEPVPVEAMRALMPAPPAAPGPAKVRSARDLEALFPPTAGAWEIVREAVEPPDAALRGEGLRASVARHYTRARGPVSEVCTLELWAFDDAARADAAATALAQPGWQILPVDALLVLAHGVRLERGVGTRRELAGDCTELAERTRARADASH